MSSPLPELFRNTKLKVAEGNFLLVKVPCGDPAGIRSKLDHPRADDRPFMIFQDGFEWTFLVHEDDWNRSGISLPDEELELNFQLVTIDRELTWDVVGFLSRVTQELAEAGISVGVLSSFSRDHLLIKDSELDRALSVLNELFQAPGTESTNGN